MYSDYVYLYDKKASLVPGGGSISGSWETRDLTDEVSDGGGICSLSSNQFTLDAGTYRIFASAPAFQPDKHQIRLYNITDAAEELLGTSKWNEAAEDNCHNRSLVVGRFTIAAQKTFEIQHQVAVTKAIDGHGYTGLSSGWGDNIYTIVELWKET